MRFSSFLPYSGSSVLEQSRRPGVKSGRRIFYHLLLDSGSNAIDASVDSGWDVNGATAGTHNGTAPDIGYDETP
jgi:hypothetical protein